MGMPADLASSSRTMLALRSENASRATLNRLASRRCASATIGRLACGGSFISCNSFLPRIVTLDKVRVPPLLYGGSLILSHSRLILPEEGGLSYACFRHRSNRLHRFRRRQRTHR